MAVAERPQLTVRRARLGDFEAVMAIHDFVYDGADYLKSMYHILLQHPDCHAYVGEVDGRVVGVGPIGLILRPTSDQAWGFKSSDRLI